jgi:quercetin dioxygenase-like cupin family protein
MGEKEPAYPVMTVAEPGAIVPEHSHDKNLLRVVISGSIIVSNGIELKSGDWMYVPAGVTYGYMAGLNPGAISWHIYC